MALSKARIEILDKEAINAAVGLTEFIDVEFNPTDYTLAKSAQIAEIGIPGLDSPLLQFIRGQNEKLTLDLFFDTTSFGLDEDSAVDVRKHTNSIYQLVKIQPATHAPPRLRFNWGSLCFKSIVESVQQKFTLFSPAGIPLRAVLSVSFREYKTLEDQLRELNLQSPDRTKRRVVKEGDTLNRISAEEYKDPHQWRLIAKYNAGVLPSLLRLVPGTILIIPPIDLPWLAEETWS